MAVNLKKGEGVNLREQESDLARVTIGLGWDVAEPPTVGFFARLFGGQREEYDLDTVAFLLGEDGKIHDFGLVQDGQPTLHGGDVVFYNSMHHPSGQIWLTGDNRTGAGGGDDEQIVVQLSTLPPQYHRILFVVQIYQGQHRKQDFSCIQNAFIRAVDDKGKELCRFNLSGEPAYASFHSLAFAQLRRDGSEWMFEAIGKPYTSDSFVEILREYI